MGEAMRVLGTRLTDYYDNLKAIVERGEKPDWYSITKRELYYLNIVERITDEEIGRLYGVMKDTVRKKRGRLGQSYKRHGEGRNFDDIVQSIEWGLLDELWHNQEKIAKYKNLEKIEAILEAIHPEFPEKA